jgi:hypothetical protein
MIFLLCYIVYNYYPEKSQILLLGHYLFSNTTQRYWMILKTSNYHEWIWNIGSDQMDGPYKFEYIVKKLYIYLTNMIVGL